MDLYTSLFLFYVVFRSGDVNGLRTQALARLYSLRKLDDDGGLVCVVCVLIVCVCVIVMSQNKK